MKRHYFITDINVGRQTQEFLEVWNSRQSVINKYIDMDLNYRSIEVSRTLKASFCRRRRTSSLPSDTVCFANSSGNNNRTAFCTFRLENVDWSPFTLDSVSKLNVSWHNSDTSGMDTLHFISNFLEKTLLIKKITPFICLMRVCKTLYHH
ncbi:unnamed protein product [Schistosoma spindalis]|nr:unnamed protein product [Schistosoma spindale]